MRPLFVLALVAACAPDSPPADAATADTPSACAAMAPIERGADVGHPMPLGAGPTEARAGVLGEADLPDDSTGLALWRAGDLVLANDRVAVIVEAAGPSDLFDPWGGKPIAVGRIEGGRIVESADFEEMVPGLGLYTLHAEHVGVLRDGSDGGPAVIRAVGTLEAIPFLAAFVPGGLVGGSVDGLSAALDWSLAPGADEVEVRWTVDNGTPVLRVVSTPIHCFLQASRMPPWSPAIGFDSRADDVHPFVAFVDEDRTSYGYEAEDGPLTLVLEAGGANFYSTPRFGLPACSRTERDFGSLVIGDRDGLGGVLRVRPGGDALRDLVVRSTPPLAGVAIDATTAAGEHLDHATTDETGSVVLAVPASGVQVTPSLGGVLFGDAASVPDGAASFDLPLAPFGTVTVRALDAADRGPIPARLQSIGEMPLARPPATFGARIERGERAAIAFEIDGETTFTLPVGRYRLVASRGYEWELAEAMLDVAAGANPDVELLLTHVVDTTDVLCGDFHIHTNRSPDAQDPGELKVRSAIADGLEVPARSDHEFVNDFEPTIAALGAERYAFGIASLELTTYAWGHFGVVPLEPDPALPNGGAIEWAYRDPPEVFDLVRARTGRWGASAMIVNHPRDSGGAGIAFAYFDSAGYDPVTGTAAREEWWDPGFSLIEVFNASDFDHNEPGTVRDWFSFLSRGQRVFAVGSSDSHEVLGSPIGYPRTCMRLGTDAPETLRSMGASVVRDALLGGHATVSGGLYVDARVGTAGPGDDASGVGPIATVDVVVQAASWIDADRLRVYVDGALTEEIPFDGTDAVLRFDGSVEVDVAPAGSWVVVVASGDAPMEPVHPGRRPFGVTNPIFLSR